ncbi:MAG: HEAT repeat domain-containing protein [Planctomycetia bacterium]|nr:HEAT repeat domain-containing protein [Planctomycetia bacterium]
MRYGVSLLLMLWVSAVSAQDLVWQSRPPKAWSEVLSGALQAKPDERPLIRQQWYAAYALGQYGKEASGAVEVLLKRLAVDQGQDDYVRAAVALALGQIGDRKSVPALMEAFSQNPAYPAIRRNAVKALGMFGNWAKEERSDVVALLQNAMENDPDMGVRTNAAAALWSVDKNPAVMEFVRKRLESSEALDVYQGAVVASALANVWEDSAALARLLIPPIATVHPREQNMAQRRAETSPRGGRLGTWLAQDTARMCTEALGKLGPDAVPVVREAFEKSQNATSRSRYLRALAAMDSTIPTMELLLKLTVDEKEPQAVRIEAVRGLRRVLPEKRDEAKKAAIQVVNDPNAPSALVYESAQTLKWIE